MYNLESATDMPSLQEHFERINGVKEYIGEHIDEPPSRVLLAAVAGYSVPHFHRIFYVHVGENIGRYVRRARLNRAGRKLRMGAVDIAEVAEAAGYESHSAFAKAFKQYYGHNPSEFRQLDCTSATQLLKKG